MAMVTITRAAKKGVMRAPNCRFLTRPATPSSSAHAGGAAASCPGGVCSERRQAT
jgi:hypothetical protein